LVSLKLRVVRPADDPATEKGPATVLVVNVVAVAMPLVFVAADVVVVPLTKVPLTPVAGAVNVTVVLATSTGFPSASSTVAANVVANAVPMAVL
jgi:hypothetical protein